MDAFTVRDLREHTGALIRDAEEGKLSVITKRGHPIFLAVPFSDELVKMGLLPALAVTLYKEGTLTLEKAAKLADQPIEAFIEKLGKLGIAIVTYPPNELCEELTSFD